MLRTLLAFVLCCLMLPALADERAQTRQQIEKARQDISELKQQLSKLDQERSSAQRELRKAESDIGALEQDIKALQKELNEGEQELKRLAQEKQLHEQAKAEQQRLMAIQTRAAYQSGRQEYLKLLLNQESPEKLSRTLTYYDYFNQARLEQLNTFKETLRQIGNIEAQIEGHQARLLVQKGTLDERRSQLTEARNERRQVLARLDNQKNSGSQRLRAREQEQAQLNRVLQTIEATLARQAREAQQAREAEARRQAELAARQHSSASPAASGPSVSTGASVGGAFAQAKGKLPWPVNGRILARYGTPRGTDARTKWDGVLISANAGTTVTAVHAGRVVFADWLRGAGLLVIVDHGNGYLSLYGHNQSLLKKPGDLVQAGEALSTVGASGGQSTPALYFAIRQQGRASDPAQWCRTQG